MVNKGIKNELIFLNYLNNKKVSDLNILMQDLIFKEFKFATKEDIVEARKTTIPEKTDIIIKIKNEEKRISLKIGSKNSVHTEPISEFVHFLIENEIPKEIVIKFLKFHYADGTTNGKGSNRISAAEYKERNIDDFIKINKYFNNPDFINKCIERFILKGRNSQNEIDILLLGKTNDFLYLNKNEIIKTITKVKVETNSIHIGPLFVQPLNRNLNYNAKYENCRFCVQIKWYSLFDNIIMHRSNCLEDFNNNE